MSRHRSNSKPNLPAPLPYVSDKACRKVRDRLEAPSHCPYCGAVTAYVDHSDLYGGRRFGKWPYALSCTQCPAYVGLHPYTDIPLGTMADPRLRQARTQGKAVFHQLQGCWGASRSQMYRWLADVLGIEVSRCHWGWFDLERCAKAERACRSALNGQPRGESVF